MCIFKDIGKVFLLNGDSYIGTAAIDSYFFHYTDFYTEKPYRGSGPQALDIRDPGNQVKFRSKEGTEISGKKNGTEQDSQSNGDYNAGFKT
jgi:hypothetical protein